MALEDKTLVFNLKAVTHKTHVRSATNAASLKQDIFVQSDKLPVNLKFMETDGVDLQPIQIDADILEIGARWQLTNQELFAPTLLEQHVYDVYVHADTGLRGGKTYDLPQGLNFVADTEYVVTQGNIDLGARAKVLSVDSAGGISKFIISTPGLGYVSTDTVKIENPDGYDDIEDGLTATYTYLHPDTIPDEEVDKSSKALFSVDLNIGANPSGLIAEAGGGAIERLDDTEFQDWPTAELITNNELYWTNAGATLTDWSYGMSVMTPVDNYGVEIMTDDYNTPTGESYISQDVSIVEGTYDLTFYVYTWTLANATNIQVKVEFGSGGVYNTMATLNLDTSTGINNEQKVELQSFGTYDEIKISYEPDSNFDVGDMIGINSVGMYKRTIPASWDEHKQSIINRHFTRNVDYTGIHKVLATGTSGNCDVKQNITVDGTYIQECTFKEAKSSGSSKVLLDLYFSGITNRNRIEADLSTTPPSLTALAGDVSNATITDEGDGWWKLSVVSGPTGASPSNAQVRYGPKESSNLDEVYMKDFSFKEQGTTTELITSQDIDGSGWTNNSVTITDGIITPDNWFVQSGVLDQTKIASGIIKGDSNAVEIEQTFATPLPVGTKIMVAVTRADANSQSVDFSHVKADGNIQGSGTSIDPAVGTAEYVVATTPMAGIRFDTVHVANEFTDASVGIDISETGIIGQNYDPTAAKVDAVGLTDTEYVTFIQTAEVLDGTTYELSVNIDSVNGNTAPDTCKVRFEGFNDITGWSTLVADSELAAGVSQFTFTTVGASYSQVGLRVYGPDITVVEEISLKEEANSMTAEFHDGHLKIRSGSTGHNLASLEIQHSTTPSLYGDVTLAWEIDPTAGTVRAWANNEPIGTATAALGLPAQKWANADNGGFYVLNAGLSSVAESVVLFNGVINSVLRYYDSATVSVVDNDLTGIALSDSGSDPMYSAVLDFDGSAVHDFFDLGFREGTAYFDIQARASDNSSVRTLSRFEAIILADVNYNGSSGAAFIPSGS